MSGLPRLTDAEVRQIRAMKGSHRASDVAARFGRSTDTIRRIMRGEMYEKVAPVPTTSEEEIHKSALRVLAVQREVEAAAKRVGAIETGELAGNPTGETSGMPDDAIAAKARELLGL